MSKNDTIDLTEAKNMSKKEQFYLILHVFCVVQGYKESREEKMEKNFNYGMELLYGSYKIPTDKATVQIIKMCFQ